jgi:hypothetical protein
MFGWRRKNRRDRNDQSISQEEPIGLDFGMGLDDARHMAHYRFAFGVVPENVFGDRGAEFLEFFVAEQGKMVLTALWRLLNPDLMIEPDTFTVKGRTTVEGHQQFVVNMPPVTPEMLEAHFFGIHLPREVVSTLTSSEVDLSGVRLLFLEESLFGSTVIGESRGPGSHLNLGSGPDATWDGMWQVMDLVLSE